jgi:hypothetical protein
LAGDTARIEPKLHLKANFMASSVAWEKLCTHPDLADLLRQHIVYLAHQSSGARSAENAPSVQTVPEELRNSTLLMMKSILDDLPVEERERLIYFFTVGSVNLDYRSMVMDGEVMILTSGWLSLIGFFDFLLLPGLCEWMETVDELDQYLDPPSGLTRSISGLIKLAL